MNVTKITKHGVFHFDCLVIDYESCWIYTGRAYWSKGYPIINRYNKNYIVSRFVWYILTWRDYRNKEIHHKCHNRACVNPFHLEEMSARKHRKFHGFKKKVE